MPINPVLRPLAVKLGIAFNPAVRTGHPPEIALQITTENQLRIVQGGVVNEPVQFGTSIDAHSDFLLDLGAVNGNHAPVRISQFDIAGVDVKLAR